ncbi:hypothetical protein DFJ63DRAFT_259356 [Scheffersomyces coipomensis]|uniref:uncharacterized protein n=1 Tax=Scheffersomyces coipomensis TaxID=1788519 RepID=UPI00315DDC9C
MVDFNLIAEHYEGREELERILVEDQERKSLIKLAVLQIVLKADKHKNVDTDSLKGKVDDYELTMNKLKQDHSTKLIGMEARLSLLVLENLSLKKKLEKQAKDTAKRDVISNTDRSIGRSENYLLPTFNSINRSTISDGKILTPISKKRPPKRKYITSNVMHLMKSPLTRIHTREKVTPSILQNSDSSNGSRIVLSTASNPQSNDSAPSAKAFVKDFDISSPSPSPSDPDSPNATPSKASINKSQVSETSKTDITQSQDSQDSQIRLVADDTFTSANSSGASNQSTFSGDESKKKKRKKLQLWKSERTKQSIPIEKRSHSLGLEDENVNSLNFYDDENFLNDDSPVKFGNKKRPAEQLPEEEMGHKKQKKNIFKID